MPTIIPVSNDWDLELGSAVRVAVAEASPWYLTRRRRAAIVAQVMHRVAGVLPLGGGGVKQPTGGGGPKQPV